MGFWASVGNVTSSFYDGVGDVFTAVTGGAFEGDGMFSGDEGKALLGGIASGAASGYLEGKAIENAADRTAEAQAKSDAAKAERLQTEIDADIAKTESEREYIEGEKHQGDEYQGGDSFDGLHDTQRNERNDMVDKTVAGENTEEREISSEKKEEDVKPKGLLAKGDLFEYGYRG